MPPKEKIPETYVQEVEKAHEMAKAEDFYRTLALNARKAGFENLAKEWEKLGGEEAEKAGQRWEEERKRREETIGKMISEIIQKRKNMLEAEKKHSEHKPLPVPFDISDPTFLHDLGKVLGVEASPIHIYKRTLYEGSSPIKIVGVVYLTNLDRVTVTKIFSEEEGKLLEGYVEVKPKSQWEELMEMKEARDKRENEG